MKTFVYNLKGTDHRKQWMIDQLGKLEMEFEFIDCIDGRQWTEEQVRAVTSDNLFQMYKESSGWLSKGAIASTLTATQKYYPRMASGEYPYALGLEDDAILPPDFKSYLGKLETMLNRVNMDGILLLNYRLHEDLSLKNLDILAESNGTKIYRLPQNYKVGGGTAFIASAEGSRRIIEFQQPLLQIVGDWWHDFPNLNVYIAYPQEVQTGKFATSLGHKTKTQKIVSALVPKFIKEKIRIKISKDLASKKIKD